MPSVREYPLSHGQQRLLFLDRLTKGDPFFHTPLVLDIQGDLDIGRLRTAARRLVERHEILRTTVHVSAAGGIQRVHPAADFAWHEAALPVSDRTDVLPAAVIAEVTRAARERIILGSMPLLSCVLYRLGPQRFLLLLRLHHIATDAWSLALILRDLAAAHNDVTLPATVSYGEWAQEQRDAGWHADAAFWSRQLAGVDPVLAIPTDQARPAVARHRGALVQSELGEAVVTRADTVTKALRLTPSAVYLGAWSSLVMDLAGRSEILVGVGYANRQPRYAGTVGFFANQLPLRIRHGTPAKSYLGAIAGTIVDTHEHASYPFEKMVRHARIAPDLSRNPLIQVGFNFASDRVRPPPILLGAAVARQLDIDLGTSRMDVVLGVRRQPGRATTVLWYDCDLYSEQTAHSLLERFGAAVEDLTTRALAP
jgi:hypothetical protein